MYHNKTSVTLKTINQLQNGNIDSTGRKVCKLLISVFPITLVPSVSPNITINNTTESSIQLSWNPLNELEDGNGPITVYTIRSSFSESTCSEKHDNNMTTSTNTSTTANITLSNLRPYWNYTITISASTSVGEGGFSAPETYRTDESCEY